MVKGGLKKFLFNLIGYISFVQLLSVRSGFYHVALSGKCLCIRKKGRSKNKVTGLRCAVLIKTLN